MSSEKKEPKFKKVVEGADQLSLGISIVVAILMGFGIGYLMAKFLNQGWLLWLGIAWGVGAAILNVYKAYKKQRASLDELKNDPKYKDYNDIDDDEEEDDKF